MVEIPRHSAIDAHTLINNLVGTLPLCGTIGGKYIKTHCTIIKFMSQFLESICAINGEILNLKYHQRRVNRTFKTFFRNATPLNLSNLFKNYEKSNNKTKIRVLYSEKNYSITVEEYTERKIEKVKIVIDNEINYSFKSANRDKINEHVINNKDYDDIIIVRNNLVTDSSYANLLFFDGTDWITPKNPLLKGTKREQLLLKKQIKEKTVTLNDIFYYPFFMQINALLSFDEKNMININKISI